MIAELPWTKHDWVNHTQLLLDSFHRYLGRDLLERSGVAIEDAKRLYEARFVVVSHGNQDDPILDYGNRTALELWEITTDELLVMPSRLTAEPMHRDERAKLLERTRINGYADDYKGIRVSKTGKRFLIEEAIIWNLVNAQGVRQGQAATFSKWTRLNP